MLRFLVPLLLSAGLAQAQTTVRPLLTLGNSASDPSTPCVDGRWYYNTTSDVMKCCINSAWAACASGGGQSGFVPNVDAQAGSSVVNSSNLYSATITSSAAHGSSVVIAPDGYPIAFIADGATSSTNLKAIKCTSAACATFTSNTVTSTLAGDASATFRTFDAITTPGGRVAFVYADTTNAKYCRCDASHACSSVSCSTVGTFVGGGAYTLNIRAVNLGSKVGIVWTKNPGGGATSSIYTLCSDPDAATPCTSLSAEQDMITGPGVPGAPFTINNNSGNPIILSYFGNGAVCTAEDCTTRTIYDTSPVSWEPGGAVVIGSDLYAAVSRSTPGDYAMVRCSLPTCATQSVIQTFAVYSGCGQTGQSSSVTASAEGLPVMHVRNAACASGSKPNYRIFTCDDADCTTYGTYNGADVTAPVTPTDWQSITTDANGDLWYVSGNQGSTVYVTSYQLSSSTVSGVNLGSASLSFADAHIVGTANVGNLLVDGLPPTFGRARFAGDLSVSAYSPAAFTGTQNNYSLGTRSYVRLDGSSTPVITGIKANNADGKALFISNVGAASIQFNNQDSGSDAANRIITGTGANVTLAADASLTLIYDSSTARWRKLN